MKVTKEINSFYELWENTWSGAHNTLQTIENNGMQEDLIVLLEEIFLDGTDEETLNNYLWFDRREIYMTLGIEEE